MANKVNKSKGKYDKSKGTSIVPANEETEDYDFSLLRKPIHTSITGLGQARKIFDLATEELKKLLSDECDVLYECKVCRNIFRSLANFISHKRVYCKSTFDSNVHGHFIRPISTHTELKQIKETEEGYQESLKGITQDVDEDERIPLTKDLTTIIEKLAKNKNNYLNTKDLQVLLQEIPSTSVAVFQNIENGYEKESENMLNQVSEINKIMSKDMGVMQSDGNFKIATSNDVDNVIQISDDEESADTVELKCKICDMQFSTQKTLKFHMKYKHVESRLVYPCPDCLEIFSTSWSVHRHLFKVHRKTPAQIRRLRESIQAKAFKMNNPPAFYERRKNNQKAPVAPKITEEERIEQENQAWMDNMEFDGEISRCGGCGRTFERRAALAAHTHTCQPRSRALARRPETKRIEIQIRKDYNKGPNANLALLKPADTVETRVKDEPIEESEREPEKEPVEKESEEKTDKMEEDETNGDENSMDSVPPQSEVESNASESPEKNETPEHVETQQAPVARLPFAQHAEKSNLMALRQRIVGDILLEKLTCKRCNTRCNHIRSLYDHVATHYKWKRYACKLCNFKHYYFEQLPEHVKIVHKLKGDKDFYFSTVKALDGAEALELSEDPVEEVNDEAPELRRRCSSDSSRLSDDSSSSSMKIESTRKRKAQQNSRYGKRKKESLIKINKDERVDKDENDTSSNPKTFEENSSDVDDICDKVEKRPILEVSSVASRRPVRRKAKPKNADFEYDLSNLLKMEAQGYRENQTGSSTTKPNQPKKKSQPDTTNYDILNKECLGAMDTLSRKAVEKSKAEMKTSSFAVSQKERPPSNVFVRPMVPRTFSKISPKKDISEDKKDSSPNKDAKNKPNEETATKDEIGDETIQVPSADNAATSKEKTKVAGLTTPNKEQKVKTDNAATTSKEQNDAKKPAESTRNNTITSVVPIKFRRQSIDVMKNPIINQNIKEFTKAGMKTKILVIKPIKVKDGAHSKHSPLKFQTIKLKDPNRKSTGEDMSSDQVVVVKVPNVDRNVVLSLPEPIVIPTEKINSVTEKSEEIMDHETVQLATNHETVQLATNGDSETNPPTTDNEKKEQINEDKSDKLSNVNLNCDDDLKKIDIASVKSKTLLKIDNRTSTSSSNGIS